MDYFGLSADIDRLNLAIDGTGSPADATAHAELAWYLRQRDTRLAREHASHARAALDALPAARRGALRTLGARLTLVEAEARWLFCEPGAEETAIAAGEEFARWGDLTGQGDALLLRAEIHWDSTDWSVRVGLFEQAAKTFRAAGDSDRADLIAAWQLYHATFSDGAAIAKAGDTVAGLRTVQHPGVRAIVLWGESLIQSDSGEVPLAIRGFQSSLEVMQQYGMLRSSITLMANIATDFCSLNDYTSSLAWLETASARAKETGWPRSEGLCQMGIGTVLRTLGRNEAALAFLQQAESAFEKVSQGRTHALLQKHLGDTQVALGNATQALHCFERGEALLRGLADERSLSETLWGKALAFSMDGRARKALACASEALQIARRLGDRVHEIDILCALARVARSDNLPAPRGSKAPNAAIYYFERAIRVGARIENHLMPPEVFSDLSLEYERAGDLGAALQAERRAAASREVTHTREASQSAAAMQVRFETDIARADAIHQRALAEAEALRVAELHTANDLLDKVSQIGQSITRSLSTDSILKVLRDRTHDVLPAESVSIWLLDSGLVKEILPAGHPPALRQVRRMQLDAPSPIAGCVRDFQPRSLDHGAGADATMQSSLLVPLANGYTMHGALVIESSARQAYGERDMHVAMGLASYLTIALVNALAHAELERTARTDKMTAIANRRSFDETLGVELIRARRSLRPLSLVLVDVDHFKLYNDAYGHQKGDECLRQVAGCLATLCRVGSDLAARYGGEEFALVLPETDTEEAVAIAERLRQRIAALNVPHVASTVCGHITISAGVSTLIGGSAATAKELIECADKGLYDAKRGGRNRTMAARMVSPTGNSQAAATL